MLKKVRGPEEEDFKKKPEGSLLSHGGIIKGAKGKGAN